MFVLLFTAAHFHLGGRQHFSFFHNRYISFIFSSNEIGLHCFLFLALALSLLSTLMQTLKFSRKKDSAFVLLLLFFLSKAWFPYHRPDHPDRPSRFKIFRDDLDDWGDWQFPYDRLDRLKGKRRGVVSETRCACFANKPQKWIIFIR